MQRKKWTRALLVMGSALVGVAVIVGVAVATHDPRQFVSPKDVVGLAGVDYPEEFADYFANFQEDTEEKCNDWTYDCVEAWSNEHLSIHRYGSIDDAKVALGGALAVPAYQNGWVVAFYADDLPEAERLYIERRLDGDNEAGCWSDIERLGEILCGSSQRP